MFQPEFPNRRFCEDSIFNAAAGIAGKFAGTVRVEGIHRFDQTDGPDGDQIILGGGCRVVFFGHMGHQAQIVTDQQIPRPGRLFPARAQCCKSLFFLCRRKRSRKRTAFQMQQKIQHMPGRRLQEQAQHLEHNTTPCPKVCRQPGRYVPKRDKFRRAAAAVY